MPVEVRKCLSKRSRSYADRALLVVSSAPSISSAASFEDKPPRPRLRKGPPVLCHRRTPRVPWYEWIWNDTRCIDKSSSSDPLEAVNSTFAIRSLRRVMPSLETCRAMGLLRLPEKPMTLEGAERCRS